MGFTKRGSWGKSSGFKVNHGRFYRPTSVTIMGVNSRGLGGGSGRTTAPRTPTKAERVAERWRVRPGIYRLTFHTDDDESINLVVDGGQMTFARFQKLVEAHEALNWEQASRAFRAFVREWDLQDENGRILLMTAKGMEKVGLDMVFGLAAESANALQIPATPLANAMTYRDSGKPIEITVTPIQTPPGHSGHSAGQAAPRACGCKSSRERIEAPVVHPRLSLSSTLNLIVSRELTVPEELGLSLTKGSICQRVGRRQRTARTSNRDDGEQPLLRGNTP